MTRHSWALLAGLLLALPAPTRAAEADLAGNWKVTILDQGGQPTLWIVQLEAKDGKWAGKVLSTRAKLPESTIEEVSVSEDRLRFTIKAGDELETFDSRVPKEKTDAIRGSMYLQKELFPAVLETTAVKSLEDTFELNKEIVARQAGDLKFFNAAVGLLTEAGDKKAKPEEVRGWAEKAYKAAEPFGPRWQQDISVQVASALVAQDGYADTALTYARRADRLLDAKTPVATQFRVLNLLASALRKADKADELKEVEARLDKVDIAVKPDKYTGRKAKSDRIVLVELFTGAQCPPCVGADLAFDGLERTYPATDVILLQYHLHIPGPDPLTNPDTEQRADYYSREVEGTPTLLFNGRAAEAGAGKIDDAPELYKIFRQIVDQLLEKPASAKLTASAVQKGNKIDVTAEVADVDKPSDQLKLRLALIEETVHYTGGNQMRHHHHVVRAFPGGAKGMAVKDKTAKQTATVDLDELRKNLTKYLDDYAKENKDTPFPNSQRPLDLKNLKVVAFLQNDKTKEVLQAVQVEVKGGAE
jgi:hypothetical protein